jgi:hypothetical protein
LFTGLVNTAKASGDECEPNVHMYQEGSAGPFCDEAEAEADIEDAVRCFGSHEAWGSPQMTPLDPQPDPCRPTDTRIENLYQYINVIVTPEGTWYWEGYIEYDIIRCEQGD